MPKIALFRRREVLLPTVWGLGLLSLLAALFSVAGLAGLYPWLAITQPVVTGGPRSPERVLVVEGWASEEEIDQAIAVWRAGGYGRLVTTGGPLLEWHYGRPERSYAERAGVYLAERSGGEIRPVIVSAPKSTVDRTYVSALAWRQWWQREGGPITQVDIFTTGPHARRSWQAWRLALPELAVGVRASQPSSYDAQRWWHYSEGVKRTLGEAASLLWSTCCFWPGRPPLGADAE